MAVGIPWLEFQYGLGPGVQDPGVDVGKSNDKGETASESAWLAAERSMGDEAMKTHDLKSGLNAWMIVVTLSTRSRPSAPGFCTMYLH
jgi:hypothetical protein